MAPALKPHAFVLAVHDLPGSAAYFIDVLGFSREWSDPGKWEGLVRDGVRVMLGLCPDALAPSALGDHNYFGFVSTDDVDGLHGAFVARGATILFAPTDRPWGWREMGVATPEGHKMMFAQWVGSTKA